MENIDIGKVYLIKNGECFTSLETLSNANLTKQIGSGFNRRVYLHSDRELATNKKDLNDIYKDYINDNYLVVRAFNDALCNMKEITLLDSIGVDIYIPSKVGMMDFNCLEEVLEDYEKGKSTFNITNFKDNNYDFYSFINNFSYKARTVSKICEYYCKEKNGLLDVSLEEMFSKYRDFNLKSLILDNLYNYELNNRNCGIVIITSDKTIKKTVTKSFHTNEVKSSLERIFPTISQKRYIDLVNDYNLVISIITKDAVLTYVNIDINDYQKNELDKFVNEVYDVKLLKPSLITGGNIIENYRSIVDGELSDVCSKITELKKLGSCNI